VRLVDSAQVLVDLGSGHCRSLETMIRGAGRGL